MPIRLSYNFRAGDESEATSFNRLIMDDLRELLPEELEMDPQPPTPSGGGEDCWEAEATIYFADGRADPAAESAQARDIADAMGAPWEETGGGARVLASGMGSFSSSFWQMNWAELRLLPAGGVGVGIGGMNQGGGQRICRILSTGG